jgi:hypothetical protein
VRTIQTDAGEAIDVNETPVERLSMSHSGERDSLLGAAIATGVRLSKPVLEIDDRCA